MAGGLEIDDDPAFAERSWRWQRVGWVVVLAVLIAALAGLLGAGPLGHRNARVPGQLRVEYQRFARYEAPQTLTVRIEPAATRADEVRLWLDRHYLEGTRLEAVTPSPIRVEAAADRLVYVFALSQPGEPATIVFRMQSEQIGRIAGRLGLVGGEGAVAFSQLVYP